LQLAATAVLLHQPDLQMSSSTLAAQLLDSVGTIQSHGIFGTFTELLCSTGFISTQPGAIRGVNTIHLDNTAALQLLTDPVHKQQLQQYYELSAQLHDVVSELWPSNSTDSKVHVKHSSAMLLLKQPGFATSQVALVLINDKFGTAANHRVSNYRTILQEDASGCFIMNDASNTMQLDGPALLRYAEQQRAAAAVSRVLLRYDAQQSAIGSSSSSSSSSSFGSGEQQQQPLNSAAASSDSACSSSGGGSGADGSMDGGSSSNNSSARGAIDLSDSSGSISSYVVDKGSHSCDEGTGAAGSGASSSSSSSGDYLGGQAAAASSRSSSSEQELLLQAVTDIWPPLGSAPETQVLHAAAAFLVQQQQHTALLSDIAAALEQHLGSMDSIGDRASLQGLMQLDSTNCFVIDSATFGTAGQDAAVVSVTLDVDADEAVSVGLTVKAAAAVAVRLDIAMLLQTHALIQDLVRGATLAAKQRQDHISSSSGSSGSSEDKGGCNSSGEQRDGSSSSSGGGGDSEEQQLLQEAAAAVWPGSSADPAGAVQRCIAMFLMQQPAYAASLQAAASHFGNLLGGLKAIGLPRKKGVFQKLLQTHPSGAFVVEGNSEDPTTQSLLQLRLDTQALLQHAQQRQQQEGSSISGSSSADEGDKLRQEHTSSSNSSGSSTDKGDNSSSGGQRDSGCSSRSSSSGRGGGSEEQQLLQQAIDKVWPNGDTNPIDRVCNWAANLVVREQDLLLPLQTIRGSISQLGSLSSLGIKTTVAALLEKQSCGCFVVEGTGISGTEVVRLDAAVLLRKAGFERSGSSFGNTGKLPGAKNLRLWLDSNADPAVSSSSSGGGSPEEQQLLQQAATALWRGSSAGIEPADLVKSCIAMFLIKQPNYIASFQAATTHFAGMFGSMEAIGLSRKSGAFKKLLQTDPWGAFVVEGNSEYATTPSLLQLRLDTQGLLRHAQRQQREGSSSSKAVQRQLPKVAAAAVSPSDKVQPSNRNGGGGNGGGNGRSSSSSDQQQHQQQQQEEEEEDDKPAFSQQLLAQAVAAVWPKTGIEPKAQIKRWLADYLISEPRYKVPLTLAAAKLDKSIGSLSKLGVSGSLTKLLSEDPLGVFVLKGGAKGSPQPQLQLDASSLLRCAKLLPARGMRGEHFAGEQQQQQQQQQSSSPSRDASASEDGQQPRHQQQQQQTSSSASRGMSASGSGQQPQLPQISDLKFELQLQYKSGWVHSSFVLHPEQQQQTRPRRLLFEQQQQQQEQPGNLAIPQGQCVQLVGVQGSQVLLQKITTVSSSSNSSDGEVEEVDLLVGAAELDANRAPEAGAADAMQQQQQQQQQREEVSQLAVDSQQGQDMEAEEAAAAVEEEADEAELGEDQSSIGADADDGGTFDMLSSLYDGFPGEGVDEAVWSIAKLLPSM
jgi:hypothetical protein